MKKYIIALVALGTAASVFAQGQITYSTRVTGSIVGHVYNVEAPGSAVSKSGNTAAETPSGNQTYAGAFLTGSGWSAQLWAANGAAQLESSLAPVIGSVVTFRTGGTLGGTIVPLTLDVNFVSGGGVPVGATGTFQLRVWNNVGGTLTTWQQAEAQWLAGAIAAGKSSLFEVASLTANPNIPPNMTSFRSFNVHYVPEPSTFALLGLGALGMLIFRRK